MSLMLPPACEMLREGEGDIDDGDWGVRRRGWEGTVWHTRKEIRKEGGKGSGFSVRADNKIGRARGPVLGYSPKKTSRFGRYMRGERAAAWESV